MSKYIDRKEACKILGISKPTFSKYLEKVQVMTQPASNTGRGPEKTLFLFQDVIYLKANYYRALAAEEEKKVFQFLAE